MASSMECDDTSHRFYTVDVTEYKKAENRKLETIGSNFRTDIGDFEWVIPEFLSISKDKIHSSQAVHFAYTWFCLDISFGGPESEFFSIFLKQCAGCSSFPMEVDLGFRKRSGEVENLVCKKDFAVDSENRVCQAEFQIDNLKQRKFEFLKHGALTVICRLKIGFLVKNKRKNQFCVHSAGVKKLSQDISELLKSNDKSDIKIIVRGEEFFLHRYILEARVPVFKYMLNHNMQEKKMGIISIDDCDVQAFQEFVYYVYSGRVNDLSLDTAIGLYVIADKYHIVELKSVCLNLISQMMSAEHFCSIVNFALLYDMTDLLNYAVDFLSRNLLDVLEAEDWPDFLKQQNTKANELMLKAVKKQACDCMKSSQPNLKA